MTVPTQAAKVGLFVALSGAAAYGIYRYVSPEVSGSGGYTVHAFIHDATGLATHSRVTIAGIPVASLEAIKLENGEARLEVKVRNDVTLYENATLGKKSTSLLGEAAVVLTPGTPDHAKLRDGDEIHAIIQEATPGDLLEEVKQIADDVKQVTSQLAKSVGTEQGGQNMKAILQNLADATDAINRTVRENRETIRESLYNVQEITRNANPEIAKILENVRTVTQDVREMMATTQTPTGQKGELREVIERLDRSSKSLESALGHIDSVSGRIDRGEGTIGKLTKDDQLVNEVQGVAEGINDYVQNISRLQTIVGLRSDYNFLSNTIKTYVQLRLQPKEDKYYLVEIINDPRGAVSITQQDVTTTNLTQPLASTTKTITHSTGFVFSLEFAKRLGPFTGRFGIIESSGGAGLDIHLLQDRFEIQNDLFGFAEYFQPRYRVSLSYEFIKHLWLLGGVDHVFDPEGGADGRDYFFGLQLRFTDDDLKTILPFSGGAASVAR
jgi:phospholipid/cholesterol/gamma-HCH transport system substrate-binding protein